MPGLSIDPVQVGALQHQPRHACHFVVGVFRHIGQHPAQRLGATLLAHVGLDVGDVQPLPSGLVGLVALRKLPAVEVERIQRLAPSEQVLGAPGALQAADHLFVAGTYPARSSVDQRSLKPHNSSAAAGMGRGGLRF